MLTFKVILLAQSHHVDSSSIIGTLLSYWVMIDWRVLTRQSLLQLFETARFVKPLELGQRKGRLFFFDHVIGRWVLVHSWTIFALKVCVALVEVWELALLPERELLGVADLREGATPGWTTNDLREEVRTWTCFRCVVHSWNYYFQLRFVVPNGPDPGPDSRRLIVIKPVTPFVGQQHLFLALRI